MPAVYILIATAYQTRRPDLFRVLLALKDREPLARRKRRANTGRGASTSIRLYKKCQAFNFQREMLKNDNESPFSYPPNPYHIFVGLSTTPLRRPNR